MFLHEGLGSIGLWKDFPQRLCDALDLRGLVYSRYGYGRSEALSGRRPNLRGVDFMHREAIDSLPQLLSQLGIEHPILFGHSDGASIALIHAATYPDVAAGLILLAPHTFVEELTVRSIEQARQAYERGLRDRLARYHDDVDSAFRGWNDIWLKPEFRAWNIEPLLPLIECPVLAIQGCDDEYGSMAQIESVARAVSATRLLKLPACRHSPHRDQPNAVIEAAGSFISDLTERL